jgi:hypothetical protein
VIRETRRPSALLVRPGATSTPLRLVAPIRALSLAAIAAGHCDVPVDAAIATAIELVSVAPHADADAVRCLTVTLRPSRLPPARGETSWIRQLRTGCSWREDTLPVVWVPAEIAEAATAERVLAALAWIAVPLRLRALLDLECAAMRAQVSLSDAFAMLTRPESTPPASA